MDCEDEELYNRERREREAARKSGREYYGPSSYGLHLRLYEEEEQEDWRAELRSILYRADKQEQTGSNIGFTSTPEGKLFFDYGAFHRLLRFYRSVKGFHAGSLDLRGRHKSRYEDLISRWRVFSQELTVIKQHDTVVEDVAKLSNGDPLLDRDGRPFVVAEHHVNPSRLLHEFLNKWHLTEFPELDVMYVEYDNVTSFIAHNPEPQFQCLHLQDLPPELIHKIMGHADERAARVLGSTSRLFRDFSLDYIYRSWKLLLDAKVDWRRLRSLESEAAQVQLMQDCIDAARDRLSCSVKILLSRGDVIQKIRCLHVANLIDDDHFENANIVDDESRLRSVLLAERPFSEVLLRARNIEILTMVGLTMDQQFVTAALTQLHLHTISMHGCSLHNVSSLPDCDTVFNVSYLFRPGENLNSWRLLPSLTRVRFMELRNFSDMDVCLPPPDIRNRINLFTTLERVHFHNLTFDDLPVLNNWIGQAASPNGPGLRLTHFKLGMAYGLTEEDVLGLISALEGAPMQYFVLEGTMYADPELFDRIADAFPDLLSLTVIYRDSDRQSKTKPAQWPYATWEYAPHFAAFHRLGHFGWNLSVDTHASPSIMLLFENDFPENWWEMVSPDSEEFDDWSCIARLFHSHCPTIDSFVLQSSALPLLQYKLHRTADGRVETTELNAFQRTEEIHNPDIYFSRWPTFTPSNP